MSEAYIASRKKIMEPKVSELLKFRFSGSAQALIDDTIEAVLIVRNDGYTAFDEENNRSVFRSIDETLEALGALEHEVPSYKLRYDDTLTNIFSI